MKDGLMDSIPGAIDRVENSAFAAFFGRTECLSLEGERHVLDLALEESLWLPEPV
jgi:hypothetical protein